MKIGYHRDAQGVCVTLRGSIDEDRCGCLEHFWHKHLSVGQEALRLDCRQVEQMDAAAVAVLTSLIRERLRQGGAVVLESPPQMLAHTLYKVAALASARLQLCDPRVEEPYAG